MTQGVEVVSPLPHRSGMPRVASVVLSVPAHKDCVVIIRSAVAQLAGGFGFTLQEITDLRLAVNEACALLVAGSGRLSDFGDFGDFGGEAGGELGGTIECRAEVRGDVLHVTVSAAAGFPTPDTDGIGWTMLTSLVDMLTWAQDGVTARVDVEKRRASVPQPRLSSVG